MRKNNRRKRRKQAERKAIGMLFGILFVLAGSMLFYITGRGEEEWDRIGDVDFSVEEPLGDKLYRDGSMIFAEPGQCLVKVPTVTMEKHSKPAYIRARVLFGGLNAAMRRGIERGLSLKNGWIQNPMDGYFYYQYPVEAEESICFFDALTVPDEFGWEEIIFSMEVRVEAAEVGCIKTTLNDLQKISGWTKIS